ncbi:MAG TPA: hypothetical protein ENL27_00895 [Candidatus Parcubacteria bacterium]|nr:hypothetical protein [Candidatus Parcubacteria bacterium]
MRSGAFCLSSQKARFCLLLHIINEIRLSASGGNFFQGKSSSGFLTPRRRSLTLAAKQKNF